MNQEQQFLARFEAGDLPLAEFNHAAHVRLAWSYLGENPLPEALTRFRDHLKRFIALHQLGDAYHETITFAFILLIHERMQRAPDTAHSWDRFVELNADLIQDGKTVLHKVYRAETLSSPHAKRAFRLPDRIQMSARRMLSGH